MRRLLLVPLALLLGACAGAGARPADERAGTLAVFAASSLTDVFDELEGQFEDAHPDTDVQLNYGPSSGLAQSITQGAPADVFATANQAQMQVVTDAGLASDPVVFTANVLEIAVPAGNPGGVSGLEDFARDDLTLAVCAQQVPCGAAAEEVFAAAGISPRPDSREEDARAALTKVQLGEVDAALVYASDVAAAGDEVAGIGFPQAEQAVNDYPIVVLDDAANPSAARAWVELVLSDAGQRVLADAGFRAP